ncbi:hypothetical protein SJ_179 [Proteus phage SJ_PmiM]|nr:hypothetical protein SJ_179 [Proteus phage SJ_PmiM]
MIDNVHQIIDELGYGTSISKKEYSMALRTINGAKEKLLKDLNDLSKLKVDLSKMRIRN